MVRKLYDMGKYESCTYAEAKKDFDKSYYTLPEYDRWKKLNRMKHYHFANCPWKYQFKRPVNHQLNFLQIT